MKLAWKKKSNKRNISAIIHNPTLPFEQHEQEQPNNSNNVVTDSQDVGKEQSGPTKTIASDELPDPLAQKLADDFLDQGNKLAEDGNFREALGKWEAAINLTPERAVLHEQKAQALLEIGDAWNALKAATRAVALEPSWAEAWITLGRAQLNYGEPDAAIKSFDNALDFKPDIKDAQDDRQTAIHLVKRRKQLHSSGLSETESRYLVGDKTESS